MDNRGQYGNVAKILNKINDTIDNEVYNNIRLSILSEDFNMLESLFLDAISSGDISKKFAMVLIAKKVPLVVREVMIEVINES